MSAGTRLTSDDALSHLLRPDGAMDRIARSKLGDGVQPVRAILFDKRPGSNWAVGWHQDRTITVRSKADAAGFGPWSKKAGIHHVEPPFDYIERMVTLRAHLDACGPGNAPLLIIPGSHKLGRIPVGEIERMVANSASYTCLADVGDVWVYATAILHFSHTAVNPWHRRVLHVDYSAAQLPDGLEWLGVAWDHASR
jgi:hypothetical protein